MIYDWDTELEWSIKINNINPTDQGHMAFFAFLDLLYYLGICDALEGRLQRRDTLARRKR